MRATLRLGLLLVGLLPILGCATANHHAGDLAQSPVAPYDSVSLENRNRVHIFIVNGNEPFSSGGIGRLRTKLNEAGYAKVSSGGIFYASKFESEIRKLHRDDPEARFVIVGYGYGAGSADGIASRLQNDGVPVDSVVALAERDIPGSRVTPAPDVRRLGVSTNSSLSAIERASNESVIATDESAAEMVLATVLESSRVLSPITELRIVSRPMIDDAAPLPGMRYEVAKTPAPPIKKPVQGTLTSTQFK